MSNKKILLYVYAFLSAIILLNIILYSNFKISYAGYWSDRVIFWLWLLATLVVIFAFWKERLAKVYFWVLLACLILSILPMGIIFFSILLSSTGSGRLNHFDLKNNIRIQTVGYGVLGRPRLQIVKDGWLFDKVLLETHDTINKNDSTSFDSRYAINAELIKETDTSVTIKYFFEKDSCQVEQSFKNKKDE